MNPIAVTAVYHRDRGHGELRSLDPRRGVLSVELTLLHVPACPNAEAFESRLAAALDGRAGVVVRRREIADDRAAAEAGMHGSPTLLIDGVDPFAAPGEPPSLSCRLYRDEAGGLAAVPSVRALRDVLAATDS